MCQWNGVQEQECSNILYHVYLPTHPFFKLLQFLDQAL